MFSAEQKRKIADGVQQILSAISEPDPRATPDEFRREQFEKQILTANQRLQKVEAIMVEQNNQLITLQEDNKSLHTRINSLETAIRQLNSPLVDGDG